MKAFIKRLIRKSGYDIIRVKPFPSGSPHRPMKFADLFDGVRYRGLKCDTFLDGGANITNVSRLIKQNYPYAKGILIEPMKELEPELKKFCNEFEDSKYFIAGLGSKKDRLTLTLSDINGASSFLFQRDEELIRQNKQRDVEIITIDGLIESGEMEIPQIIKLDIQGFELEALKAATKTFGKTELYLLETSMFHFENNPLIPDFTDVFNFMSERNYVPYEFPGFLRSPYNGAVDSVDVAFVIKNGTLIKVNKQ